MIAVIRCLFGFCRSLRWNYPCDNTELFLKDCFSFLSILLSVVCLLSFLRVCGSEVPTGRTEATSFLGANKSAYGEEFPEAPAKCCRKSQLT